MEKLREKRFVSNLVIFFQPAKTVGMFLRTRYLSESREGVRTTRPGLIQKKNENTYLCAFLSTKPHSRSRFNAVKCCPLGDLRRILRHENYIMSIDSRSVFEFPSFLVEQWKRSGKIKFVAACFFDLQSWSEECVKRIGP
ncbi:MAG: Uncharacterized protein XD58_0659 [Thermotoga sp. 50_1627]|nr:MAG: Uncharacterized protein XD45_0841 [Thermotoga sp. 50_64]KUK25284.1 MAG: Uncharacterized protein XD58_0659 [Thermotoga sp. 50_1627]MDK2922997.1 hypothetical protein [Pseudothermotoga sp.]HBT39932.1 hypothetical protein [Pseudothermotoga sp.]HCO97419.1 hypothetical protein [Pseudothermotoga sp.]